MNKIIDAIAAQLTQSVPLTVHPVPDKRLLEFQFDDGSSHSVTVEIPDRNDFVRQCSNAREWWDKVMKLKFGK